MRSTPTPGELVAGRYQIDSVIGSAPGYTELRAFDREVEVDVAILWYLAGLFPQPARFVGSALELRGLIHPHLRRLFAADRSGDTVYLSCQLGTHSGLAMRLGTGRPAEEIDVLRYATAVCEALDVSHKLGHVHGYLMPTDLVEVSHQVKVSGVGLYRDIDRELASRCFHSVEKYLSPEVRAGGDPTPASDVYSTAAILVELASGVSGALLGEATEALAGEQFKLADALAKALSTEPDRRPQSARALLRGLRRVLVDARIPTAQRPIASPSSASGSHSMGGDSEVSGVGEVSHDDLLALVDSGVPEGTVTTPDRRRPSTDFEATRTDVEGLLARGLVDDDATRMYPRAPEADDGGSGAVDLSNLVPKRERAPTKAPTTTLVGAPPMPVPQKSDAGVQFVSHKKETLRGRPPTPMIPVMQRPNMEPRIRPVSSINPPVPRPSGHLAPPRDPNEAEPPQRAALPLVWMAAGIAAITFGVLVGVIVIRGGGDDTAAAADAGAVAVVPSDAGSANSADAATAKLCPEGMIYVDLGLAFCIDPHEAPGKGEMPRAKVTLAQASADCAGRGARLCNGEEWEQACRGGDGQSFPYGMAFREEACNAAEDYARPIKAAGSFPECVSPLGIYDMSGNVAEWVEEGQVRGGSARDYSDGRCSRRWTPAAKERAYPDVGYRCCAQPLASSAPTE